MHPKFLQGRGFDLCLGTINLMAHMIETKLQTYPRLCGEGRTSTFMVQGKTLTKNLTGMKPFPLQILAKHSLYQEMETKIHFLVLDLPNVP